MLTAATLLPSLPVWHSALVLAPPLALLLAAVAVNGRDTATAWRLAARTSVLVLLLAGAALLALALGGAGSAGFWRSDWIGGGIALLVAFIGWVIVRYSATYLAGEPRQQGYVRALLVTLASVLLVLLTNHLLVLTLAWGVTSLALHRLLTFYRTRPPALVAAHKKFLLGRAADICLLAACALLYAAFGTLRIDTLAGLATSAATLPVTATLGVLLLTLAALLKCAQLPFHGWLIQVMEAPTPVSALLHAGVINLGGFALIRLAPLVAEVPAALALMVLAGGATALLAALVMSTRISVKVMLAWSTCAQMGFMLMQCGLGLWEMALLHLVAHSLYKAHAFLGAGGAVRQADLRRLADPVLPVSAGGLLMAAVGTLALAGAIGWGLFGLRATDAPLWVMAGIVALASTQLLLGRFGASARAWNWLRALGISALLLLIYFTLHTLLQPWVAPTAQVPDSLWWLLVAVAFVLLFGLQNLIALRPGHALVRRLYPWFYGGLFLDEQFSRLLFSRWPPPHAPQPNTTIDQLPDADLALQPQRNPS